MSTICAEQQQHQHKFHSSHQLLSPKKSPLREIDIPPRKLLTRRAVSAAHDGAGDMFSDDTILHKFLPHNDSDSDSDDPYSSDHFRMYEFKVRRCTRSRSHDWTDCPFAHPGEKARRRDPRRYHYSGTVCPEYRRGGCSRGDGCEFAHGVFECWLHPARYRTEACKDGKNCKRKVCFFAHTPRQLRILPVTSSSSSSSSSHSSSELFSCNNNNKKNKLFNLNLNPVSASSSPRSSNNNNNCCLFCHCGGANNNYNSTASPTSTLFGMSHFSPPVSPRNGVSSLNSPVSRFRYKDVLAELMGSFEGLSFNNIEGTATTSSPSAKMGPNNNNLAWLDVVDVPNFNFEEQQQQQQQKYIVSPSAVSNSCSSYFGCDQDQQKFILSPSTTHNQNPTTTGFGNNRFFFSNNENKVVGGGDVNAPDLGWVNDLLM